MFVTDVRYLQKRFYFLAEEESRAIVRNILYSKKLRQLRVSNVWISLKTKVWNLIYWAHWIELRQLCMMTESRPGCVYSLCEHVQSSDVLLPRGSTPNPPERSPQFDLSHVDEERVNGLDDTMRLGVAGDVIPETTQPRIQRYSADCCGQIWLQASGAALTKGTKGTKGVPPQMFHVWYCWKTTTRWYRKIPGLLFLLLPRWKKMLGELKVAFPQAYCISQPRDTALWTRSLLYEWFEANQLTINFEKTHHILFTACNKKPRIDTEIVYENKQITAVTNTNILGIYIDDNMSWICHIEHISSKLNTSCYIITSIKPYISVNTLKKFIILI
jgi:hypothetical protein